mmetsp:Transcript_16642/g.29706  ORF Transcript_16642/g.29706 Transcript_16642/m.29706 type:complete len:571 (+) Transcript_16642:1285-2997(+)
MPQTLDLPIEDGILPHDLPHLTELGVVDLLLLPHLLRLLLQLPEGAVRLGLLDAEVLLLLLEELQLLLQVDGGRVGVLLVHVLHLLGLSGLFLCRAEPDLQLGVFLALVLQVLHHLHMLGQLALGQVPLPFQRVEGRLQLPELALQLLDLQVAVCAVCPQSLGLDFQLVHALEVHLQQRLVLAQDNDLVAKALDGLQLHLQTRFLGVGTGEHGPRGVQLGLFLVHAFQSLGPFLGKILLQRLLRQLRPLLLGPRILQCVVVLLHDPLTLQPFVVLLHAPFALSIDGPLLHLEVHAHLLLVGRVQLDLHLIEGLCLGLQHEQFFAHLRQLLPQVLYKLLFRHQLNLCADLATLEGCDVAVLHLFAQDGAVADALAVALGAIGVGRGVGGRRGPGALHHSGLLVPGGLLAAAPQGTRGLRLGIAGSRLLARLGGLCLAGTTRPSPLGGPARGRCWLHFLQGGGVVHDVEAPHLPSLLRNVHCSVVCVVDDGGVSPIRHQQLDQILGTGFGGPVQGSGPEVVLAVGRGPPGEQGLGDRGVAPVNGPVQCRAPICTIHLLINILHGVHPRQHSA